MSIFWKHVRPLHSSYIDENYLLLNCSANLKGQFERFFKILYLSLKIVPDELCIYCSTLKEYVVKKLNYQ